MYNPRFCRDIASFLLTFGAEPGAALSDDDAFDDVSADQTGLSGSAINLQLALKPAAFSVRAAEILDAGAAGGDSGLKH